MWWYYDEKWQCCEKEGTGKLLHPNEGKIHISLTFIIPLCINLDPNMLIITLFYLKEWVLFCGNKVLCLFFVLY